MGRINDTMLAKATEFIWTTGSVLDQHRMAHFIGTESGAAGVRAALDAHRTGDGGFAFAVEPDVKGPDAQPLSAMTAMEILDEVDELDAATAGRVCDWLARHSAPDGGVPDLLPSIETYPHPPWVQAPPQDRGGLLTTARTVGLLLRNHVVHPWVEGATAFCRNAIDDLASTHPYEVLSVGVFLDHAPDREWAQSASRRIGGIVRDAGLVLLDPANPDGLTTPPGYAEEEFHFACDFAASPESLAVGWFSEEELRTSLDRLAAQQYPDGGWPIHYRRWNPAIEQQARPGFTLLALRTLRAWDRAA